jgi:uncharacterized protein (TIGR04255 family)
MGSVEPAGLPSFRNPPLEEVALAVQFQPGAIDYLHVARLAESLRERFPRREEQPGRPPMREDFEPPVLRPPFEIEVIQGAPTPRFWLLSEEGSRLLQLQADLIAYNWRRAPEGVPVEESYPRYSTLRREFEEHFAQLQAITAEDNRTLSANWCEVTYINHIGPAKRGGPRLQLSELLRGVKTPSQGRFLPAAEDGQFNIRFIIPGEDTPRGRLTVATGTAVRRIDFQELWVMTLTARVKARDETPDGAMEALDLGHEWVVRAFYELTSDRMHKHWQEEVTSARTS